MPLTFEFGVRHGAEQPASNLVRCQVNKFREWQEATSNKDILMVQTVY